MPEVSVRLGGYPDLLKLDMDKSNADELVAVLPIDPMIAGDYKLTISQGKGGKDQVSYDLTIGAAGAKGKTGPVGLQGEQGPKGDDGADSTVPGPQGPQGEIGLQGTQGEQGPQGEMGYEGSCTCDVDVLDIYARLSGIPWVNDLVKPLLTLFRKQQEIQRFRLISYNTLNILLLNGARGRNRTGMVFLPRDFKSLNSYIKQQHTTSHYIFTRLLRRRECEMVLVGMVAYR